MIVTFIVGVATGFVGVLVLGGMARSGKGSDPNEERVASCIVTENPNIKWDQVVGLEGAKNMLKEGALL